MKTLGQLWQYEKCLSKGKVFLKPWKLWVSYDNMRSVYEKVKYFKPPWKLWVSYDNMRSVYEKVKCFKAMKTLGQLW